MKRAIRLLQSDIRAYQSIVSCYEATGENNAIGKGTYDDAIIAIGELEAAVAVLEEARIELKFRAEIDKTIQNPPFEAGV